jgi:thiosulfate reductase cytochrome b subunit
VRFEQVRLEGGRLCYSRDVSAVSTVASVRNSETLRHAALVRVTHWITVISFFALLITGGEIVISHPRFYWGETGNVNMRPLFTIPIPSSRDTVPTGYGYVMPDQNGWSRYLHFQSAWVLVLTGLVYVLASLWNGHLRKNLLPAKGERSWRAVWGVIARYLRRAPADGAEAHSYNVVQRVAYLSVVFVLFPLVVWTGLALSPAFNSAVPAAVNVLGGRQSARTLHFFVSGMLVIFLVVHVAMVALAGFWSRVRAMITGRVVARQEHTVISEKSTVVR